MKNTWNHLTLATAAFITGLSMSSPAAVLIDASTGNGGNDEALVGGEIPSWTEVVGTSWTQRSASPTPEVGSAYFYAGAVAFDAELAQTVDVSEHIWAIDVGFQRFDLSGWVSSWRAGGDTSRIILEFEDASANVLDSFDSGAIYNPYNSAPAWQQVTHSQFAPAGTRQVQVRLIAGYNDGTNNDGYFDSLQLFTTNVSVPEPSTLALLVAGMGMLMAARRTKFVAGCNE